MGRDPIKTRRQVLRGLGLGMVAGTLTPIYARQQAYDVKLHRRDLKLPGWKADGFKVGVASDFHLTAPRQTDRAIDSMRLLFAAKPDVIVTCGDFVEHDVPKQHDNVRRFLKVFEEAPCPCVGVFGNHDYWSLAIPELLDSISRSRLQILRNEIYELSGVTIAGVDDYIGLKSKFDFYEKGKVSQSLIALLHEPDIVKRQPDHVCLQISGHSHGGQVCLPFGKQIHTPAHARQHIAGFYPKAKVPLYVTTGVGTTGVDYRLFCDPEVALLTLRGA